MCVAYVAKQFDADAEFQRTVRAGAYELGTEADQIEKVYEVELRDRLLAGVASQAYKSPRKWPPRIREVGSAVSGRCGAVAGGLSGPSG